LVPGTEKIWDGDSVIVSIGRRRLEWIKPEDGLDVTPRGTLALNQETLMTTAPGVFCGGDIALATPDHQRRGRWAARGARIHAHLQHVQPRIVRKGFSPPCLIATTPTSARCATICAGRAASRLHCGHRRIGVAEVEQRFDERWRRSRADAA